MEMFPSGDQSNHHGKIVLIEDDAGIREILSLTLEMEGYSTQTARNGKEGLALLANGERPDLILLDLMMPVMDGWSFLKAREADHNIASIPVVILSAYGDSTKEPKADGVVRKPIKFEALDHYLQLYCGK